MTRRARAVVDSSLRRRAEDRLAADGVGVPTARKEDLLRLVHELEVCKVELELQNEELRVTRTAVEEGLQRYTELFEAAPVGYVLLDTVGLILQCNRAAARVLGVPREQILGSRFALFVDPDARPSYDRFLGGLFSNPDESPLGKACELTLLGSRGELLEVCLIASVLSRALPQALVAIEDVSAKRRAEAALRAEAVLKEESVRKDEFIAILSHELRNPLAPIRTSLWVLDRVSAQGLQEEDAAKALAVLRRQVDHLVHIVDDLLDATRIARGKVLLDREPLDLAALVRRTVDDYRPSFQRHMVRLALEVDAPGGLWVLADATRIAQVLGNLLGNALKFTPKGGRVEVWLRKSGARAGITVRDSGVGIAPEVLRRLFRPFMQAPQSLDRSRGGLGLGLVMVKGLTELHGGTVEADSRGLGHGAEFTVWLTAIETQEQASTSAGAPRPAPRRVLVIEDNVDAGEMLRELLVLDGHEVRVASEGATGLELAREFRPELVLCDIGLPGMDGFEVARRIRADAELRDLHVVALTGYTGGDDQERAIESGFDQHVGKPLSAEALERLLRGA